MPRQTAKAAKKTDRVVAAILDALERFKIDHPGARIDAYRRNPAVVMVRIIAPEFAALGLAERENLVWSYLEDLDDEIVAEIYVLLLITPEEKKTSHANFDFENPIPWPDR
ncbi:MAG: hypothetical protein NVSMB14_12400 [Isosphaeraceae bacterium]